MARPSRVRLFADALEQNLGVVRRHAPNSRVMAVVKADAYGHGLEWVAGVLESAGADAFGVACIEEGVRLREAGIRAPVFILEGFFRDDELSAAESLELGLVLHRSDQVERVLAWKGTGPPLRCFLKVDTGMHRLGLEPETAAAWGARLAAAPGLRWEGLFSHMARADTPEDPYNRGQVEVLEATAAQLPERPALSLANSGALLEMPESRMDWVRPGLMLYGASPFPERDGADLGLKQVLRLESEIITVRRLEPGDWIGYGTGFQADRIMRVGVVPLGYGDGYPRHLETGTPVRVAGRPSRTLGRVCMDMVFVDLEPMPEAREGSPVELLGPEVPAEVLARAAGTIPYEILCGLRMRLQRLAR
ncbi:alanine racemase [Thiohalorhabdus sp.]|uniref:alanine racemase n=1 Tax=Thiohalorhabdus sp. TaxID=3094134 RepID=UPI002FC384DF